MSVLRRKLRWLLGDPKPEGSEPLLLFHAIMMDYIGIVAAMYYRVGKSYQRIVEWHYVGDGLVRARLTDGNELFIRADATVYCVPPARKSAQ